ncbi:MAG TPA: class I SAM-dependent methyltransferase [Vicinamibacterales bacterium]|nr:class I SAM-dependent methyltransferase [Vicinamibacterales bacterium]
MDPDLRRSMLQYYDERAAEYEDAYLRGTGTSSIPDPNVFRTEAWLLGSIVERFGTGRLIDLACGTAFWLPRYAGSCSSITLFDQSGNMLQEAQRKAVELEVEARCAFIRGDFFEHDLPSREYDTALVGFFLSHVTDAQEPAVFAALERLLDGGGRFLILDSAWSAERARFNAKSERQERRLNDGSSFHILKRYFDRGDIDAWAARYGLTLSVEHFGTAFFAVSGAFA